MTLIMRTALASDAGLVRENNEDTAYAGRHLVAVADGMGGPPAGEVASEIVVRALVGLAGEVAGAGGEAAGAGGDPGTALWNAVAYANRQIREAGRADPASGGMGSTVTAVLLVGTDLTILHVGDSRGYLLRDGELRQITRDDTLVQELVDRGVLTAAQARHHPQRSLITNAVQGAELAPVITVLAGRIGDRLLLCSDGLSDVVDDDAIGAMLHGCAEPEQCAEQLVKLALRAGAPDNVTVVVADLVSA